MKVSSESLSFHPYAFGRRLYKERYFLRAILACILLSTVNYSYSQLAEWKFTSASDISKPGTNVAPNVTASVVSVNNPSTTISYSAPNSWIFAGWPATPNEFSTNGKFWEFSISPSSGYNLNITSISFDANRTTTGPANITVQYSLNAFATLGITALDNVNNPSGSSLNTFSLTNLPPITSNTITVRIWGYNASSGTGNFRLNNIIINGSVIPSNREPYLSSPTATNITSNSATLGGTILFDGNNTITERGTVYKTSSGVTINDNKKAEGGTSTGVFSDTRTGLSPQTLYYYKAYATNGIGNGFTDESSFYTLSSPPQAEVTDFNASPVNSSTINLNWTEATFPVTGASATGYIILRRIDGTDPATSGIANGSASFTLPEGTSLITTISNGTTISYTTTGLTAGTQYNYLIIPFTWDGVNNATRNYYLVNAATANALTPCNGAAEYFRSKQSGFWNNATTWESSADGITWGPTSAAPTNNAKGIVIRSGHNISISSSSTAALLTIQPGGILTHNRTYSFYIADNPGFDFIVEGGGTYIIRGTAPSFEPGATAEIQTGALVIADGNDGGGSDDFARLDNVYFRTDAVMQWANSRVFQANGVTYFPNANSTTIPIFRVTYSPSVPAGGNGPLVFNGKFETTTDIYFHNSGAKIFRNGIGGTGRIINYKADDRLCGPLQITGSNSVIEGSVELNLVDSLDSYSNVFEITSSANVTINGNPKIIIGSSGKKATFLITGKLLHNGATPIDLTYGSLILNGSIDAGSAGTFSTGTSGSTVTNIAVGGTGDAGILNFTSNKNHVNNFTINRNGPGANISLGSDVNIIQNLNIIAGVYSIGAHNTTLYGTISGNGMITGSALSNLTIAGTSGNTVGILRFTAGNQLLNNLSITRSGTGAGASLGTDVSIEGILNIQNADAALAISSNTLNINGTIIGNGSLTGTTQSNLVIGGNDGGNAGVLSFTGGSGILNSLTIKRFGANAQVDLGCDLDIKSLTLTHGIITTGYHLFIKNNTGSYTPPVDYTDSWICTCNSDGSTLNIPKPYDGSAGFKLTHVLSNKEAWFPVGADLNSPNKMYIKNTDETSEDNYAVFVGKGDIGHTPDPRVNRIWYVSNISPTVKASMKLFFTKRAPGEFGLEQDEIENGFDYNDIRLLQKDYRNTNYFINKSSGTDIEKAGTEPPYNVEVHASYNVGVSPDASDTLVNGITSFNMFSVVGGHLSILPIKIINFHAFHLNGHINISWTNLIESEINYYELERSNDGIHFVFAEKITAKNANAKQEYLLKDEHFKKGANFYRLKIVEKNGSISYSPIELVQIIMDEEIKVYPNPVTARHFTLYANVLPGRYALQLFSSSGQMIWQKTIETIDGSIAENIVLPLLAKGKYELILMNEKNRFTKSLMIQ